MLVDIIEILHEIGFTDKTLRKAAAHYVENRFPAVNCTVSRFDMNELCHGLLQKEQGTIMQEPRRLHPISEAEEGNHEE